MPAAEVAALGVRLQGEAGRHCSRVLVQRGELGGVRGHDDAGHRGTSVWAARSAPIEAGGVRSGALTAALGWAVEEAA